MELNIFSSNTTNAAVSSAIDRLGKNNLSSSRHIVIAPDRYSLSVEKEIYDRLNLKGSFNIDVVSFSRLAQKTLKQNERFLSKEATVMLMKKVIEKTKKDFVYFNKMTFSIGFAKEMFAVVASLRNSSISVKRLEQAVSLMPLEKRGKYQDIALIYSEYESTLNTSYSDTISRLESFIRAIKSDNLITQSHIYVVGFNVYSQKQIDIICELLCYTKSVNIAAATDSQGANKALFPSTQIEALKDYCQNNNIKVNEQYSFQKLDKPFDVLHREFFAYNSKSMRAQNIDRVRLFGEKNPYEEVKAVAREIIYHIKRGKRFKDISVVCCNEDYKKCIIDIFDRFNIPFFIDQKYSSRFSLTAKYLLAVMEAVMHNFRRENVLELTKHPYFGIEKRQAEAFENYCLEYNINFNRFIKEFSLGEFSHHEIIRKKIVEITDGLTRVCYASEISEFLLKLCKIAPQINWKNNHPNYEASEQCHDKIIELIEEIKDILGGEEMAVDEYYSIFTAGLNSMEIALLPQYLDSVFVGNTKESRFSENDIMFIVGANQGFFPFKNQQQTIITYADILNLEKYSLDIKPNPMENNTFEQFILTDLIVKAKKLYVSASNYSLKGEPMLFGEGIKELSHLLNKEISSSIEHEEFDSKQGLMYHLATPQNAFYEYISDSVDKKYKESVRKYLERKGFSQKLERLERNIKKESCENLEDYFFKKQNNFYITSVSQLESYFRCPYVHFLRYGLKVKEKPIPDLRVKDIGIIIHDILEKYFSFVKNRIRTISNNEIVAEAKKAIDQVFDDELTNRFCQDEYGKNILNNIKKECMFAIKLLTKNVKNSSFTPTYLELYFKQGNKDFKALTIHTQKGKFSIHGKIDRVDTFDGKVAIIDYKTGAADGKVQDVYYGKKIQLYVYLSVFMQNGYQPAGVFYLPIPDGYRSQKQRFALKGQVEKSEENIKALDNIFVEEACQTGEKVNSEILSLSASPREFPKNPINSTENMLSVKEFENICSYVYKLIEKAIDEICQGNMDKAPVEKICDNCQYNSHCSVEEIRKRTQPSIKKYDFIKEEMHVKD